MPAKKETRLCKSIPLKEYCHHITSEEALIEAIEWSNGEGFDIIFTNDKGNIRYISLTYGELQALNVLINTNV